MMIFFRECLVKFLQVWHGNCHQKKNILFIYFFSSEKYSKMLSMLPEGCKCEMKCDIGAKEEISLIHVELSIQ